MLFNSLKNRFHARCRPRNASPAPPQVFHCNIWPLYELYRQWPKKQPGLFSINHPFVRRLITSNPSTRSSFKRPSHPLTSSRLLTNPSPNPQAPLSPLLSNLLPLFPVFFLFFFFFCILASLAAGMGEGWVKRGSE